MSSKKCSHLYKDCNLVTDATCFSQEEKYLTKSLLTCHGKGVFTMSYGLTFTSLGLLNLTNNFWWINVFLHGLWNKYWITSEKVKLEATAVQMLSSSRLKTDPFAYTVVKKKKDHIRKCEGTEMREFAHFRPLSEETVTTEGMFTHKHKSILLELIEQQCRETLVWRSMDESSSWMQSYK